MDKIAVVTGAGWTVVALDLRLDGDGHCDVGDVESVKATFERIGARFGYVDALVCSAGTLKIGALADMAPEDFDQLYRINTPRSVAVRTPGDPADASWPPSSGPRGSSSMRSRPGPWDTPMIAR